MAGRDGVPGSTTPTPCCACYGCQHRFGRHHFCASHWRRLMATPDPLGSQSEQNWRVFHSMITEPHEPRR